MSLPVVTIGFILLVPSVLGMIASALMLAGILYTGGTEVNKTRDEAIAHMRENQVPEPIIAAVGAGRTADADSMMKAYDLPEYQKSWVRDAEEKIGTSETTLGMGAIVGGGFAIALGVGSFVGGLLGWLLVMKKRVLQCSVCRAVINAS